MAFARIVPSMFTGSMHGAGALVIATWTYALANARIDMGSTVELFPATVADALGEDVLDIIVAIEKLCATDPMSRTSEFSGARLVRTTTLKHPIKFQPPPHENLYYIPSYEKFSMERSNSSIYWKLQKRKQREMKRLSNQLSLPEINNNSHNNGHLDDNSPSQCPSQSNMSAQEDEDEDKYNHPLSGVIVPLAHSPFSTPSSHPPIPRITGLKTQPLEPTIRVSYEKEISRANARLQDLKANYSKPFPKPILSEIKSIKARTAYLKRQLGAVF